MEDNHSWLFLFISWIQVKNICGIPSGACTNLPSKFLAFCLVLALLLCTTPARQTVELVLVCGEERFRVRVRAATKKGDSGRLVFCVSVPLSSLPMKLLWSLHRSSSPPAGGWRELFILQELFVVKQKVPGEISTLRSDRSAVNEEAAAVKKLLERLRQTVCSYIWYM